MGVVDPVAQFEAASGTEREVWEALFTVEDPELPVSIVDLGLVYDVAVSGARAEVEMTLTYSGCPARDMIVADVEEAVGAVPGVRTVEVSVVHSPPWSVELITERGREELVDYGLAVPESAGGDATADGEATCE